MPSEKIELPPMPKRAAFWRGDGTFHLETNMLLSTYRDAALYTADQMTAYALLAVKQERERICRLLESNNIAFPMHGKPELLPHEGSGSHNGMHYAAAIRKGSQQEKE